MEQDFNNKKLGIKIRELREGHGDTQERLAKGLPIRRGKRLTGSAISKWENGESEMLVKNFREICKRYRADANELLELSGHNGKLTDEERDEMLMLVKQLLKLLEE